MGEKRDSENVMMRLARFIVNKRKAFIVLFILACIYSAVSISKVEVINELTEYLPENTETKIGLDIMESEFTTFGTAKVLLSNITYENALSLAKELEEISGISSVSFYEEGEDLYEDAEMTEYYKDASALLTITFEEEEDTELSQEAMAQVRSKLEGYSSYVYTTVDKDDAASLKADMRVIVAIVILIILLVLLFTSKTYMEIVIFLVVFGVAALLNMGTNYWFGNVSFITNAVGAVLQLALAIDYAIILFHRFMEEHETKDTIEAITVALSKAIPEISSSSLTTVSGMVALMFMQFGIGMDLGRVLTKAILFSLITVFLLMPALIVMFSQAIDKTIHRSFVPSISIWGKLVVKLRYLTIPGFLVIVVIACQLSAKCPYIYDTNSIESDKKNEFLASKDRIEETFEVTNTMAIVVPKGDYEKEANILNRLEMLDEVDTAMGLANVEVTDDGKYILVDKLNPREFSEVADVDLDLVRLLYQYYALDSKQYSAFMKNLDEYRVSIIDMVDFIYEQKENGGIDFDEEKSEDIDTLYDAICDARKQLEGEKYDRLVFTLKGAVEGEETFRTIDEIRAIALDYYDEAYVVGDATSNYDLSNSFQTDNTIISILTALFVGIILLFTFQSAGLPILLVLTIQGSIWINFSIPYLTGSTMFFLSYLIVSSIQMGATIDYAIVITSRYLELRKTMPDRKKAIIKSLDEAFPTIVTSGTIMMCAGFSIGFLTSNAVIASLGKVLGQGVLISIILVMTVLPQFLLVFDKLIDKTELTRAVKKGQEKEESAS
ncbi:MAG: MMPL family transporter [bacterium]|nr:MMPL family transporter [bacterium]